MSLRDKASMASLPASGVVVADRVMDIYRREKLVFGKRYFPHYFRKKSPPFHVNLIKASSDNLNTAIHAPRGSSKSTVVAFLDAIHGICMKSEHFIVIVQNTYAKASASLNNIKFEVRYNAELMADFGVEMKMKDAEGDTIFTHPDGFSCRVLCKGADQLGSIRGERFGAYRPTLILVDDLEDDEMVRNPERRIELEKQFNEVLNYAGEAGETRIVVIGTVLHDDALMSKLLSPDRYLRFKKLFFDVITEDDESLWPEKWSRDDLRAMEAEDPVGFAKEMRGNPSSGSLEMIRREDFRYWKETNGGIELLNEDGSVRSFWKWTDCRAAIGVDLAWETEQSNDYSAFVPGIVTPGNDLLIDNYIFKRGMRPEEWEIIAFDLSHKYEGLTKKRVSIGVEKSKLEKVMKFFLQEAMRRRNEWLWLRDISWGTKDKVERFYSRMANRYAQHAVYHKRGMGEYENQIIRLRSVAHDDIADAAGMLPEMLAYAPTVKKTPAHDDAFMKLRQFAIDSKAGKRKNNFVFGIKGKRNFPFKTEVSPI